MSDTTSRPEVHGEAPPTGPSSAATWAALLGGPVLWATHFMVVYLAAEATCAPAPLFTIGDGTLVALVVAATVVGAGGCVAVGTWAWYRHRHLQGHQASLGAAGAGLAVGSFVSILAVGLPALVLHPC